MRADRLVAITLLFHESCLPFVKSLMPGRYHIIEPDNCHSRHLMAAKNAITWPYPEIFTLTRPQ